MRRPVGRKDRRITLRGRFMNVLVTDEDAAAALLRGSRPPRGEGPLDRRLVREAG